MASGAPRRVGGYGPRMLELAAAAVEAALAAGARYADARVVVTRHESVRARNRVVEDLLGDERAGLGVRALVGSSWGFHADRKSVV